MTRARDVLYVAGITAASTPSRSAGTRWSSDALVPADAPRDPETASSPRPISGRSRRAPPLAPQRGSRAQPRRRRRAARLARPRPAPSPAAARRSRCGPRARSPSRIRCRAAGAPRRPIAGADWRCVRGRARASAAAVAARRCRGGAARGSASACSRGEFADDPDACRGDPSARRRPCSPHPALAGLLRAGEPRRGRRSSGASRRQRGDYAVSGRIDRLAARPRPAGTSSTSRPTARARLRRRRSTRPTSCSWRSIGGC